MSNPKKNDEIQKEKKAKEKKEREKNKTYADIAATAVQQANNITPTLMI